MKKNEYRPRIVSHPGATLFEKLEELGMGAKEFAIRTNKPEKTITAIISGKSSITPEMSVLFENVLKIPANFWLKRQSNYDEAYARKKQEQNIIESIEWAKNFPYSIMSKLQWVKPTRKVEEKVLELFSFFGIASKEGWANFYLHSKLKVAFRISLKSTKKPEALSAWLKAGELQSEHLIVNDYNEKILKQKLLELKKIMEFPNPNVFVEIQEILAKAGVKVVYTPCLPKAPINGSTRWYKDNPLIQLSGRHKKNDIFCFTLFHEIGHILLHGKKDIFLEDIDYEGKDSLKEQQADEFASNFLLSKEHEKMILQDTPITKQKLINYANKFDIHPATIIGRFQHKGLLHYRVGRELIENIEIPNELTKIGLTNK